MNRIGYTVLLFCAGIEAHQAHALRALLILAAWAGFAALIRREERESIQAAKYEAREAARETARTRAETMIDGMEHMAIPAHAQHATEPVEAWAGPWLLGYLAAIRDMRQTMKGWKL